jgi:FBP C-terminal treble-clef zinc-finger
MFKLESEDALLEAFRPKDRKAVELTKEVTPPMFVRDYLKWAHPSGAYVYLVFATPGGVPTGIVFETNGGGAGPPVPGMCDWCHSPGLGSQVGLLTAKLSAKKKVGVHVCTDLSCKEKLEDEANRSGRSALPMIAKLIERMGRFASEALQIDLSGAGR